MCTPSGESYRLSLDVDELRYLFCPILFVVMIVVMIVAMVMIVVMVVVMITRSVLGEDDGASHHRLIARAIHAVDEEVILTWCRIGGYLDVVVVDRCVALVDRVLLVEAKRLRLVITVT